LALIDDLKIKITTSLDNRGLASLREEQQQLKRGMDQLVESGQRGSDAYKSFQKRAGELSDTIKGLVREQKGLSAETKMSGQALLEMGENISVLAFAVQTAIKGLIDFGKEMFDVVSAGAELSVLKEGFNEIEGGVGKANVQLELLKKATSGNLTDAEIIKLSNATRSLGFSSEETARFMDLAERRTDLFGGSIESTTQALEKFILTGQRRSALTLNFDLEKVNETMRITSGLTEKQIQNLTDESAQRLRLQATLKVYGSSLDDINSKQNDQADTLKNITVELENAKAKLGQDLAGTFIKLSESLGLGTESASRLIVLIGGIGSAALQILPAIGAVIVAFTALNISTGGILIAIGAIVVASAALVAILNSATPSIESFNESFEGSGEEIKKLGSEIETTKQNINDLKTVIAGAVSANVLSKTEQENYNKTLEKVKGLYPEVVSGVNDKDEAEQINLETLKAIVEQEEERLKLQQQVQIDKQVEQIGDLIDANIDYLETIEDNKKALEELVTTGQETDAFGIPRIIDATDRMGELRKEVNDSERALRELKLRFQEVLAEGIKNGNLVQVFQQTKAEIGNNIQAAKLLEQAFANLTGNTIANILNLNQALAQSAEIMGLLNQASVLIKVAQDPNTPVEVAKAMEQRANDIIARIKAESDRLNNKKGNDFSGDFKPGSDKNNKSEAAKEEIKKLDEIKKKYEEITKQIEIRKEKEHLSVLEVDKLFLDRNEKEQDEYEIISKTLKTKEATEEVNKRITDLVLDTAKLENKVSDEVFKQYGIKQQLRKQEEEKEKQRNKNEMDTIHDLEKANLESIENVYNRELELMKFNHSEAIRNIKRRTDISERDKERLEKAEQIRFDIQLKQLAQKIQDELYDAVTSSLTQAFGVVNQIANLLGVAFSDNSLVVKLQQAFSIVQSIVALIKTLESISSIFGFFGGVGSIASKAIPFAEGGYVSGPGSWLSDSIPAWLSNGEFVVNAHATSQNLPLLHAINGNTATKYNQTAFNMGGLYNNTRPQIKAPDIYIKANTKLVEFMIEADPAYQEYKNSIKL